MNERTIAEEGPTPEEIEAQKYLNYKVASDEEHQIFQRIQDVLTTTPDRVEADRIITQELAPLMSEAMKKSKEALGEWLGSMGEIKVIDEVEEPQE